MFVRLKKISITLIILGLLSANFSPYFTPPALAVPTESASGVATAAASWTHVFLVQLKEFGLDLVARIISRRLLSTYLNSIVSQINKSGRTGRQPSFVNNWRNLLTAGQYRGEDVFRSILGNTPLCAHFGNDLRLIFNVGSNIRPTQNTRVNNLDPFDRRAKCTMPKGWTTQNYQNDFGGSGGWQALVRLSHPENNLYGGFLMSLGELAAQRALEANADFGEVQAGRGHTGTRASCEAAPTVYKLSYCANNPTVVCESDFDCPVFDPGPPVIYDTCTGGGGTVTPSKARCTFLGSVLTPGQVLGDAASQYIDKNIGWLITSDEIAEVALNLVGAIIDRMTSFSKKPREGSRVGTRADTSQADPFVACTRTCRGKRGQAYADCIEACGKATDQIDTPGDYNFQDNQPPPTPIPDPLGSVPYGANFQANNGQYVVAELNGGGAINANRDLAGPWETFRLLDLNGGSLTSGDSVAIRTEYGYYFRADGGGGSTIDATATDVGPWEQFIIENVSGAPTLATGDGISLRTWNNINYVFAELGGGDAVGADRTSVGPWETFTITFTAPPTIILPPPPPPLGGPPPSEPPPPI